MVVVVGLALVVVGCMPYKNRQKEKAEAGE